MGFTVTHNTHIYIYSFTCIHDRDNFGYNLRVHPQIHTKPIYTLA